MTQAHTHTQAPATANLDQPAEPIPVGEAIELTPELIEVVEAAFALPLD